MKENNFIEKSMSDYHNFRCTANKCKFTCCSGWDINVDKLTYDKWNKEYDECKHMLEQLKIIDTDDYIIFNKKTSDTCAFLDCNGLCEIVKSKGDEYLSSTCQRFPRVENVFEGIREYTLSCACPEVVNIIEKVKDDIVLNTEDKFQEEKAIDLPIEIKIRDTIVKIIREKNLKVEQKLIISYSMILNLLESKELTEEVVLEVIGKYSNRKYIEDLTENLNNNNYNNSIKVLNNLFLDIIENYKKVPVLEDSLKDISKISMKIYRGGITINKLEEQRDNFINTLNENSELIENCIITKILGRCINEDIQEVAISLQLIILEYILVRHSMFLKWILDEKENMVQSLKDYIVVFSRVIENNDDTVIDFIEEQFGDILLQIEYLKLISII